MVHVDATYFFKELSEFVEMILTGDATADSSYILLPIALRKRMIQPRDRQLDLDIPGLFSDTVKCSHFLLRSTTDLA